MADVIPLGQPILVGHHSEWADRNYRGRIDRTFVKASLELTKAKRYEEKAAAVGRCATCHRLLLPLASVVIAPGDSPVERKD